MARRPIVQIMGPSGRDLVAGWGSRLKTIRFTDYDGGESDELEVEIALAPPIPAGPAKGTRYTCSIGWEAPALRPLGEFTFQSYSPGGNPESGYTVVYHFRSSDFIDAMKSVDSEHFDEQPAGDVFRHLASRAGVRAIIDDEIAGQMIGYRLRWNQSLGDFATALAEDLGGTFKPAGGSFLVTKRGSGRTASGTAIPTIVVPFSSDYAFDLSIESRTEFKDIGGAWFDPLSGLRKLFEGTSIGQASRFLGLHPFPSEVDAERAGKAYARELARKTVSGGFDMAGRVDAQAGAPVRPQGYGPEIDALDLVASSITHEIDFEEDGGWVTSVEVESREGAG